MRSLTIIGAVLVLVGLWLILRPPAFTRQESVFQLGGLQATIEDRRPLPEWIGGTVLGGGLALLAVGLLKRS